ncbi:MAG: hypothetical protein JRN15_04865 [Nitrososphaerota archaeon]|nr:hypothetical protein [Nitrososphaerota archaeon]
MNEQDMINQALSLAQSTPSTAGQSVPWYEAIANAVDTLTPAAKNVASTITAFNQANTQNVAQQALVSTSTAPGQINLLGQAFSQYWWILILALIAILAIIFAVKQ